MNTDFLFTTMTSNIWHGKIDSISTETKMVLDLQKVVSSSWYEVCGFNVVYSVFIKFDVHVFLLQLMDTNAQLWYIIREYISNSEVFIHETSYHIWSVPNFIWNKMLFAVLDIFFTIKWELIIVSVITLINLQRMVYIDIKFSIILNIIAVFPYSKISFWIVYEQDRGIDSADLISFLLELSFHVTGEVSDFLSIYLSIYTHTNLGVHIFNWCTGI